MTKNKRIIVNFLATYGRSLYSLACGLFTSRWVLASLGETDFGLFGLVGGLTAFVTFFNDLLSSAVSRYYAFSVGMTQKSTAAERKDGLDECQKWFNTALAIHTLLPIILIVAGYAVGKWAVENYLAIPTDRVQACVWVFRWVCLSCFIGMANVPFRAMYGAKQEIAELTVYSVIQTTANVIFVYYMVFHPGDWLARYGFWMFALGAIPQLAIAWRALVRFPECKVCMEYWWDWKRFRELASFAAYRFWGAMTIMMQSQGMAILVNKFLGAEKNASMAIANSVSSHATTLSSSMDGAMQPAIANECGAGDLERMRSLAMRTCKFGAAMVLVFAIPLFIEIDEVLKLWLKTPPPGAGTICRYMLAVVVLEKISSGHYMSIFAVGKIKGYQFNIGLIGLFALPLAWALLKFTKMGIAAIGAALVTAKVLAVLARLFFAQVHAGLSIRIWIKNVLSPLAMPLIITVAVGMMTSTFLSGGTTDMLVSCALTALVFIALAWCFALNVQERHYFSTRIGNVVESVIGK